MERDGDRSHASQGHDDEHEDAMNASTIVHGVSRHDVVVICKVSFGLGLPGCVARPSLMSNVESSSQLAA